MSTSNQKLALNPNQNHANGNESHSSVSGMGNEPAASAKPKGRPRGYKHTMPHNVKGAWETAMQELATAQEHLVKMREWQGKERKIIAVLEVAVGSFSDLDHRKPEAQKVLVQLKLHQVELSDHIADAALAMTKAERTLADTMINSRPEQNAPNGKQEGAP